MTNFSLEIYPNAETLYHACSAKFVLAANNAISKRGKFLVALSGGETPLRLYNSLSEPPAVDRLDWRFFQVFWSDERRVDLAEELSNYYQAWNSLLGKVPIPSDQIHRIKSNIDTAISAANYADELKKFKHPPLDWPIFDLILLGLGMDGHTASIFPGSPLHNTQAVIPTAGAYKNRPSERVTMTPEVINSSREVLFLVSGAEKSSILARVLDGGKDLDSLPAQRIQPSQGTLCWMVDHDAAHELKNRSV